MVAMTRSEDQAVPEDPTAPEGMVTMTIPAGLPEIAVGASERWKEMDFTLSCEGYEKVEQLLEASTPALEVLRVLVKYPSLSRTMGPFTLSTGPPLKELVLYRVCTSWSSPRFTNLARLDLGGTNSGPSINQLLRILSNSPKLEHLSLVSLQPPNYGASSLSGTTEPIVLEHLQTLNLFLATWDPLPEIKLKVEKDAPFGSLVPWSSLLRSLHVKGSRHCRKALRELATQAPSLDSESTSWMCPALLNVTLEYEGSETENVSLDFVPLRSLLHQRWSNSGPESVSANVGSKNTVRGDHAIV
ncbi:hypothetical protein FRC05_000817 [Tulasnella sp. 425]|nr:hypothetical protein FRC05_000817 [Tulasnella sp. 425]